eukprot:gb/GEZJ01003696.1/.p2 GENE.gb/GEZJ01003696.1/~~gb/GEZJ01003696.1/.p2  ORF type:complete len:103 (+),score=6.84 gb/GEZJ01003696.1/:846-1154(+)
MRQVAYRAKNCCSDTGGSSAILRSVSTGTAQFRKQAGYVAQTAILTTALSSYTEEFIASFVMYCGASRSRRSRGKKKVPSAQVSPSHTDNNTFVAEFRGKIL